ncbi:14-3-3 protein 2-like [Cynara cardunculus var. scolymus]|uniref:14-3-3 protein 2-like n=1 Tax=Cynara cardunculus var. scolymus TaxID=59895 RepID=UPI000D62BBE6|nr:14-3-3 protein 2-like [Cynara cardunculus var. scolymus]
MESSLCYESQGMECPLQVKSKIEKELSDIGDGILKMLDKKLVPSASSGDSNVFYLKMKGDYHRYLPEFKTGGERKEAAESTLNAYKAAQLSNYFVESHFLASIIVCGVDDTAAP